MPHHQSDDKIAVALLTYREHRFRLSYILRDYGIDEGGDEDDFSFDEAKVPSARISDDEAVSEDERRANERRIA